MTNQIAIQKALQHVLSIVPDGRKLQFMEVCGTHTMSIAKMGLRGILGNKIRLVSGPGCPVCVTSDLDLTRMLYIAEQPDVIITTFGDMMRVPVGGRSLFDSKASGADVRIVYSPDNALKIASENPHNEVVFIAVGFETTIPTIAATIIEAESDGIKNFSILPAMKIVPPALRMLCGHPKLSIDGFILPGHVSTIIGTKPYRFITDEFALPGVITGFSDCDIADALLILTELVTANEPAIVNSYKRAVQTDGNQTASVLMDRVFIVDDAEWRGIGMLQGSGLKLREEYLDFDAGSRFALPSNSLQIETDCRCGEVILGKIIPTECRHFAKDCTPNNPLGPCMVSSEGACAAYFKYRSI